MVRNVYRLQRGVVLVGLTLGVALFGCGADETSVGAPNKPDQRVEALSSGQITSVVAAINQAEIKQAQTALVRLEDDDLRAYAEQLITDHKAHDTELKTLVGRLGVKEESSNLKSDVEEFSQKMNRSIDQEPADLLGPTFIGVQIKMHKKAIATVEQALSQARQAELRTYLENYLAALQKHLDRAMQLRKRFPEMESRL